MAPNDTQEQSERRQQILEAALHVFGTKGFHRATNKDIAEAAGGISPGLIYWYFKDKEDLFLSIIREKATILGLVDHPQQLLALPPRQGFALIAGSYLRLFSSPANAAFFRLILSEASRFPQIGDLLYRGIASRLFRLITQYLQHQIDIGTLRPHDTGIATRSFIGMVLIQVLAREIMHQPEALSASDDQIVTTIVEIFVRGLEAALPAGSVE